MGYSMRIELTNNLIEITFTSEQNGTAFNDYEWVLHTPQSYKTDPDLQMYFCVIPRELLFWSGRS